MLGSKGGGHAAVTFPGLTSGFGLGVGVSGGGGRRKMVVEVGVAVVVAVGMVVVVIVITFVGGGADVTMGSIVDARSRKRAVVCIHLRSWDLDVEGV
ncbi:MAG: hypothetical protein BYD32DRAFT_417813 [Podila humilis]|nr:MAG: hypothetical protein BYD32DRAFT_417813 [Podila humilis]